MKTAPIKFRRGDLRANGGNIMSTIENFENAPIGATATDADGNRAMKTDLGEWCWVFQNGDSLDDELMERRGYTLDSSMPTTAREALDLAWELAHEVKEGQIIPEGTQYLEFDGSVLEEYTARLNLRITPALAPLVRTLEPLPEPEPDWLDAPAVMARLEGWVSCADPQVFSRENQTGTQWVLDTTVYHWYELVDVTPLYPKGQEA